MPFVQRRINVSFSGSNVPGGADLTGHRVQARISLAGPGTAAQCHCAIYGMTLEMMNKLALIGYQGLAYKKNVISIWAGDDVNGMSEVFTGDIIQAWPDMQAQPQVAFRVEATQAQWPKIKKVKPSSYSGATPVETPAKDFAKEMGFQLENNGVKAVLYSPYFRGTAVQKMFALGRHGRFNWTVENNKTLAMWPLEGVRKLPEFEVSKETGMVSSPVAWQGGIIVKLEFTKLIRQGQPINVKSIITEACGSWNVGQVDLALDALVPKGEWFITLKCYKTHGGGGGGGGGS